MGAGARIGKGEGFAELEYGILRWLGVIDSSTKVVTTVHDDQVVPADAILTSRLLKHDVPVDIIVTPTKVIRTETKIERPSGIYWDLLSPEKLGLSVYCDNSRPGSSGKPGACYRVD